MYPVIQIRIFNLLHVTLQNDWLNAIRILLNGKSFRKGYGHIDDDNIIFELCCAVWAVVNFMSYCPLFTRYKHCRCKIVSETDILLQAWKQVDNFVQKKTNPLSVMMHLRTGAFFEIQIFHAQHRFNCFINDKDLKKIFRAKYCEHFESINMPSLAPSAFITRSKMYCWHYRPIYFAVACAPQNILIFTVLFLIFVSFFM